MTQQTGRPRKQFCPKGHDTYVVGRDSHGTCVACRADRSTTPTRLSLSRDAIERDVADMRARVEHRRRRAV